MVINLHKREVIEKGAVITIPPDYFLARTSYQSPALDKEINLDFSAFLLDDSGQCPSVDHFIFYGNPLSPDGSVKWFDDLEDPGATGEMTLGIDLTKVEPQVVQIVLILTIHEPKIHDVTISDLNHPWIRFCFNMVERYRFEPMGERAALSLEFCRILRNGSNWVLVATGVGSPNELREHALTYLPYGSLADENSITC